MPPFTIPVNPGPAVSTICAPLWPNGLTVHWKTPGAEQVMFCAATAVSVIVMLVQLFPEPLIKCRRPKPDGGALKLQVLLVITGQGWVQTGSRMMIPGSYE